MNLIENSMKEYVEKPFSIELAKKITSGEVEGRVKTKIGEPARIICFDRKGYSDYPIIGLFFTDETEVSLRLTEKGTCYPDQKRERGRDFILEVLEEVEERPEFEPFQRVLVRDYDTDKWKADLFSDFYSHEGISAFRCVSGYWIDCIPYEGNEHLLGTSESPEK